MRSEVIFYCLQISRNSRGGGFRTPTPPPSSDPHLGDNTLHVSTSILFSGKLVSTNSFFSWTEIDEKSNMAFKDSVRPWFTTDILAARVAPWLERRALMILELGVRTPLWDVGAGLSDETV